MHRALLLPEIVAAIIRSSTAEPGFLYNCLTINKVFFHETARILWDGCGARYYSTWAGHATPQIRHLAQTIHQNPQHAQTYANFIKILAFEDEGESAEFADEARFHDELAKVSFPLLEELELHCSNGATTLNTGDTIRHYLGANIKRFGLHDGSLFGDDFLDALREHCPRLRWFTLTPKGNNEMTQCGLTRFFSNTNLEYIDIRAEKDIMGEAAFDGVWSKVGLEAVSRHPNLELFAVPVLEEDWIITILNRKEQPNPVFPKLKYVYSRISDHGLNLLHALAPSISVLTLENEALPPTQHTLTNISAFTNLNWLKLKLNPDSCLYGSDLLLLARNCRVLTSLSIGEEQAAVSTAVGISDKIMEKFAKQATGLKKLHLSFLPADALTHISMLALGTHCPDLEQLSIPCTIKWVELAHATDVVFPNVWLLQLAMPPIPEVENEDEIDEEKVKEDTKRWADEFVDKMPKLTSFSVQSNNKYMERIADVVSDILIEKD